MNGTTLSGSEFTMPDGPVTVTAVVDTAGQLFYDNMQNYAGDTNIPVGADMKWTGEFGKLVGGIYTRLIRQDEKGNRYLEMTATNTASSTGPARFWLDTAWPFSGSYMVRMDVTIASDPFYVLDIMLLPSKDPARQCSNCVRAGHRMEEAIWPLREVVLGRTCGLEMTRW